MKHDLHSSPSLISQWEEIGLSLGYCYSVDIIKEVKLLQILLLKVSAMWRNKKRVKLLLGQVKNQKSHSTEFQSTSRLLKNLRAKMSIGSSLFLGVRKHLGISFPILILGF